MHTCTIYNVMHSKQAIKAFFTISSLQANTAATSPGDENEEANCLMKEANLPTTRTATPFIKARDWHSM